MPRKNKHCALINPEAGVTPVKPAIANVITPIVDGFALLRSHANPIQTMAEEAEVICETKMYYPQGDPEVSALPALKPNHPNHNMAAPTVARGIL